MLLQLLRPLLPLWVILAFLSSARSLRGQSPNPRSPDGLAISPAPVPFWDNRGRWTFGTQIGFALENDIPRNVSHIALLIAQPRLGFTVLNFRRTPVRSFGIVGEGIVGNAVHPGGRLFGATILFRLDGRPRGRAVPFFEFGGGILDTTVHAKVPELTGRTQFMPQGGIGCEYFFNPQRAFVFEYRYVHISNSNLEPPNPGINGSMVTIGFQWLRRPRPTAWQSRPQSHNPLHYLFGRD